MRKNVLFSLPLLFSLLFSGCSDKDSLPQGSFLGAAAIGDLVSLEIADNKFTFKGVVGILKDQNMTVSGTLKKKEGYARHVYSSPEVPGFSLVITPESISYHEDGNTFGQYGVVVRQPKGSYSKESIAGVYNFVSQDRGGSSDGTFIVKSDNTWLMWKNANGSELSEESAPFHGEWVDTGAGYLKATSQAGFSAHVIINPSKIMVIDLVSDHGMAIGMKQETLKLVSAKYNVIQSNRSSLYAVNVENNKLFMGGQTFNLNYNDPWKGFVKGHDFSGLLSPNAETFFGLADNQLFVAVKE